VLVALGSEHHHRQRAGGPVGAQPAAHLQAVDLGQHQVQYHQVGRGRGDPFQRGTAVRGALDGVSGTEQVAGDDFGDGGVVVDDKDAGHPTRV
jgi:hypothetical protein